MKKARFSNALLTLLRIGMGAFFLCTGFLKLGELDETAQFLTRSQLLPESYTP